MNSSPQRNSAVTPNSALQSRSGSIVHGDILNKQDLNTEVDFFTVELQRYAKTIE